MRYFMKRKNTGLETARSQQVRKSAVKKKKKKNGKLEQGKNLTWL